jgi:N utilization substance protein B
MTTFAQRHRTFPEEPKAPPKSARRRAREFVLQGLYQWRVGGADEAAIEAYAPEMEGFAKADREFFVGTLRGVIGQHEKLVEQISAHIDRPFTELSPVEACILMMGSFEMLNHPGNALPRDHQRGHRADQVLRRHRRPQVRQWRARQGRGVLRPAEVAARKKGK